MLPYIIVPPIELGPLKLQPFGILVAGGILLGINLAQRRARHVEVSAQLLASFVSWILVGGFVGAHVLDTVFYRPSALVERPWLLLMFWDGLSSFGGFIGATVGALAFKYFSTEELPIRSTRFRSIRWSLRIPVRRATSVALMPLADVVMAVFPAAWIFGRAGCSVVHDHPGVQAAASSWFTVAYGPGPLTDYFLFQVRHGAVPRYDLGLLEMLFAIVLTAAFAWTWRSRSVRGWYVVAACIPYAVVRFLLDFLRLDDLHGGDVRYAWLTPAQWACLGLFIFGNALAIKLAGDAIRERRAQRAIPTPTAPTVT